MLDRVSLSSKNGWIDSDGRIYIIYTVEQVCKILKCGKDKASKLLAELDSKKGIGLIERVRRGLCKPDKIYVKDTYQNQWCRVFICLCEEKTVVDYQRPYHVCGGAIT